MCMGFGCNAAGIIGCRIIDSPRERLIAMITNNFVPCNGRFPTMIAIITMFFIGGVTANAAQSLLSAFFLTGIIILGILMTFLVSRFLSATILSGVPSSFTLELPPFRKPQIGKVLLRSIFDRTMFVLGRAVTVAAPAGLVIWIMANITVSGQTLLAHCAGFLDPFAKWIEMCIRDRSKPESESQTESGSSEQRNALNTARDYLDFMSFSRAGLIDQLEYEGFSTEDATWAADNCGADWNEQALQQAIDYLDFTAFSYDGLIDQLEYEGFTSEQATYGVSNCGADWMEQAALCAQEYLDYSDFSRSELIDRKSVV